MTLALTNSTIGKALRFPRKALRDIKRSIRRPERNAFLPMVGSIEPEAVSFLDGLVKESRNYSGPIIEIGTLVGITTTTMALAKAPEQKIITVDLYCWNPWGFDPHVHETLADLMLRYLTKTGHVERLRMDKDQFYNTYKGPAPSMVFLDAMHDYEATKVDIEWARRIGAKIIAGHDYCDLWPGVQRAVDEFGGPAEKCASVWRL